MFVLAVNYKLTIGHEREYESGRKFLKISIKFFHSKMVYLNSKNSKFSFENGVIRGKNEDFL